MIQYLYRNSRPRLTVTSDGERNPFNCVTVSSFTVTSTYLLTEANLQALFASGAIGYGQEFRVLEEQSVIYEEVPCVGIDGNKVIANPLNPYSGKPYKPIQLPVYVCKVETTCDSGD